MDRLQYLGYWFITRLVALLPLPLAFCAGEAGGLLAWALLPKYRRLARRNLAIAFGQELSRGERRRLERQHFRRLGGNLLTSVCVARYAPERLRALVAVEGFAEMDAILKGGRGCLMVISHLGNWEVLAQIYPILFAPAKMGTVFQRLGNPYIDADVRAGRARLGVELFERREGFQGALRVLRAHGITGVLVDQHAGDGGLWCPFFGRLASTSSLAAMMALRTGAALVMAAVYTEGRGRWRLRIRPLPESSSRDVNTLTAMLNRELEAQIRAAPADWFWVHNRWKLPRPKFLLHGYKRGLEVPAGTTLQPFRLLVRSSNWLGDAVMSAPAVRAMKAGRPDLHLTVLTPAKLADFWRTVAEVDAIIPIGPKDSVWKVARQLTHRFDAAVVLPNSLRTALEVWLAGIPRRVGYPGHRRRWLLNQVWQEKRSRSPRPPSHHGEHYLRLARFIGAEKVPAPLARATPPPGGPLRLGLCPGAEYGAAKRWLPERFRQVMQGIGQAWPEAEWWLFGVAKDAPVGEEILQGFTGRVRNRIGQTTLAELIEELRRCTVLLTNDTGTMHLAAHLGVPVVAIFGSTEPRLTGPLGPGHHVLRHHVECSPCFLRECPLDFRCMHAVTAEEAVQALRRALPAPEPS